ncbi:MAG: aldo/keto reductase [Defluviitaleaceae bacterium]|nr:aldo/keto reductase [Defluviitaleaceae bacterium]
MQKRRLGKTELMVSPIGYGALGLAGVTPESLRQAVDGGINYIDSARLYTDSEKKIGLMFKETGYRDRVILSTKSMGRTLDCFRKDLVASLAALGTDYIDIFILHDVSTKKSWELIQKSKIIEEMKKLKERGIIKHMGVSTHDGKNLSEEIIKSGYFEVAMLAYNAANPELESTLIPLAKSLDLGIIAMKPYGGGVLTEKRSRELGFEISAREALQWAVSNTDVSVVLPGMDSREYVGLALDVLNSDFTFYNGDKLNEIAGRITIKGRNYCRGCGYCMPCPQNIPIKEMLKLNNRWEVYFGLDWSQMTLINNEFANCIPEDKGPERCTKCGGCVQKCPYGLAVPELMEQCVKIKNYKSS